MNADCLTGRGEVKDSAAGSGARGSPCQGGAGDWKTGGRSELLVEAKGLKGTSGDRAVGLACFGRGGGRRRLNGII